MNIVTYCSAVAISPVRKYAIGLYVGTLSWENFKRSGVGVLQVLNQNHAGIVGLLGTQSGRDVNKMEVLQGRPHGLGLLDWHGIPILKGCSAGLLVRLSSDQQQLIPCGDHELALCDVIDCYCGDTTAPLLTTGALREQGII
jgi:flavin reductase (DIM6/NTAB) family NADH-FMN oxidoreductase RutF